MTLLGESFTSIAMLKKHLVSTSLHLFIPPTYGAITQLADLAASLTLHHETKTVHPSAYSPYHPT
jgi:hypothetical protein